MSSSDFLIDATTRNAVYLQRLASGESKKAIAYLDELQLRVSGVMASGDFTQARKDKILADVAELNAAFFPAMSDQILDSAKSTASYTAGFTQRLMNKASKAKFNSPDDAIVEQAVLNLALSVTPGKAPITTRTALNHYSSAKSQEILRSLNDSFATNATKDQSLDAVNVVFKRSKKQADTLVRTLTNGAANAGRMEALKENSRFLKGYEWVAKLDSRTTLTCAGRDGKTYEYNSSNPMPPAHWGCRSQIVAAILPQYQNPGMDGEREAEDGKITPNTTYGAWLKRQPTAFQNEALGPERAQLFRRGGLKIDRFTDQSGKVYTLDQLRALEPQAFELAGLGV